MLADDLCQNGLPDYHEAETRRTLERIARAQKYVLATQTASVVDSLAQDFGGLTKTFPFCRIPYPLTWVEFVHRDRPHFAAAVLHAEEFQAVPKRVGFLLNAVREDLSAWKAHLFWQTSKPGEPDQLCAAAHAIGIDMRDSFNFKERNPPALTDVFPKRFFGDRVQEHPGWTKASEAVRQTIIQHTKALHPDYGHPTVLDVLRSSRGADAAEKAADLLAQLGCSDWAGEIAYLLATVGLMNARNTTEAVPVDLKKLNQARRKRGKPALLEHHILKIHRHQQRRTSGSEAERTEALRGHFVAGHWKVRKTGIFFWRPYPRGDFAKGEVTKDYELT
jgi:hypothetical protein